MNLLRIGFILSFIEIVKFLLAYLYLTQYEWLTSVFLFLFLMGLLCLIVLVVYSFRQRSKRNLRIMLFVSFFSILFLGAGGLLLAVKLSSLLREQ